MPWEDGGSSLHDLVETGVLGLPNLLVDRVSVSVIQLGTDHGGSKLVGFDSSDGSEESLDLLAELKLDSTVTRWERPTSSHNVVCSLASGEGRKEGLAVLDLGILVGLVSGLESDNHGLSIREVEGLLWDVGVLEKFAPIDRLWFESSTTVGDLWSDSWWEETICVGSIDVDDNGIALFVVSALSPSRLGSLEGSSVRRCFLLMSSSYCENTKLVKVIVVSMVLDILCLYKM